MRAPGGRTARLLLAVAVALLAIGVHANTLSNGFALDDEGIILENPNAHGLEHLGDALTSQYWPKSPPRVALYRPVTVASFAVDWELWGSDPAGYHAVNVALHAIVSILVFLLLLELGIPPVAAAAGAALFAVHPLHTEAVANVVGRAELLAAIGFLGACILYLRRRTPAVLRLPGIVFGYLLALGAKEIAITLPLVLLLLEMTRPCADRAPADGVRAPLAQCLRRLLADTPVFLGLLAAAATYGVFRLAALGVALGNDVAPFLETLPAHLRVANAIRIWPEYARLLFFPLDLVSDYSPAVILPVEGLDAMVVTGLVIGALTFLVAVASWREERLLSAAVLWFAITIFPVSNLVVPIGVLLAERTLYLPSVALALGVAVLVRRIPPARPAVRAALLAAGLAVIALAGWRSWVRNPVWASTQSVMTDLVLRHPEAFRAQWAWGKELVRRNDTARGLEYYQEAVRLVPTHFGLLGEYGNTLLLLGRAAEAEPVLRRALALIPEYPSAHTALARALLDQHRHREAFHVITRALALHAGNPAIFEQLAWCHVGLGNWTAAANAFRAVALLAPDTTAPEPGRQPGDAGRPGGP